jgi:hypothetical protein
MTVLGLTDLYKSTSLQSAINNQGINNSSMAEVADASEDHGQAQAVGGGDDFGVAL